MLFIRQKHIANRYLANFFKFHEYGGRGAEEGPVQNIQPRPAERSARGIPLPPGMTEAPRLKSILS